MLTYCVVEFESAYHLPYRFIGSTVRGVLGRGLKQVICSFPSFQCNNCPIKKKCPYVFLFENSVPKYRLQLQMGGKVRFKLLLFEKGVNFAPLVVRGLQIGFSQIGLGGRRERFKQFKIKFNGEVVGEGERFIPFQPIGRQFFPSLQPITGFKTLTPIRIWEGGLLQRNSPAIDSIFRTIWERRSKLIGEPIVGRFPKIGQWEVAEVQFQWEEIYRYSERQHQRMGIGGVMGWVNFKRLSIKGNYLLRFGELLGVGKQTTFGLGTIQLF